MEMTLKVVKNGNGYALSIPTAFVHQGWFQQGHIYKVNVHNDLSLLSEENARLQAELDKVRTLLPSSQQKEFNAHAGIWSPHLAYSSPETLLGWAL